jgi:tetratricopeptide (TPR) repeat protein
LRRAAALYTLGQLSPEQQVHYAVLNYESGNRYHQSGDWPQAIAHYQQAIAMNPALADLTDVRAQLRLTIQAKDDVQIKVSCAKR